MTRDELRKHWEVIEAFKNGDDVEVWDEQKQSWTHVENPMFHQALQYRIAVRDWAWACKMMLEGKRVTYSDGRESFTIAGQGDFVTCIRGGTYLPSSSISKDALLATDWRLA